MFVPIFLWWTIIFCTKTVVWGVSIGAIHDLNLPVGLILSFLYLLGHYHKLWKSQATIKVIFSSKQQQPSGKNHSM